MTFNILMLRMIKDIEKDLSPADRNKYYKAVKGITDVLMISIVLLNVGI